MKHVFSVFSVACVVAFTLFLSTTSSSCKKEKGDKGDTGVANVRYSPWLTVPKFQVEKDNAGDTVDFIQTISAPLITDSVLNKGEVRVFINVNTPADPNVIPLPMGTLLYPILRKGAIDLVGLADFSTFNQGGSTYNQYRYIIISGAVPARMATDYKSLKEAYKIPD
jgi:hypothetical protein